MLHLIVLIVFFMISQILKADTEESDRQWEDLNKTTSVLIGGISTDSGQILSEHLEKEKARLNFTAAKQCECEYECSSSFTCVLPSRWSEIKEKVIHTLKRSHSLLKVWRRYSDVRSTCLEQLQRHREQLAMHNKTPADNKQLTHSIAEMKTVSAMHIHRQPFIKIKLQNTSN